MGFTVAYSAVSWTAGDVITEAKLDAMVANDQAYDSHSAQGFEIDEMTKPSTPAANKIRLYAKDKSGVSTLYYLQDDGTEVEIADLTDSPIIISPVLKGSIDGWINANETWTYASATTITVPSGATSKYQIGDKIKFTQTTVKYMYIVGVSDTVLTVTGGSDYTVANAAISNNYYSHQENPIGFPSCFAYTAGQTGFSVNQALTSTFRINGRICTVVFNRSGSDGTSNANSIIFSLPVNSTTKSGMIAYGACSAVDNGSVLTNPSGWRIDSGNSGVIFYKQFFDGVWTTSGSKSILGAVVTYFI